MPSIELPPLSNLKRPKFSMTVQQRSSSKTTTSAMILDTAMRSSLNISIFENDPQDRLRPYGDPTLLKVATQFEREANDLADFHNHKALTECVATLSSAPDGFIHYDTSAGSVDRLPDVFDQLELNERLTDVEANAVLWVPTSANLEIAAAALHTFRRMGLALPDVAIIPVFIHRDGPPENLDKDHPLFELVSSAQHGVLQQPKLNSQILRDVATIAMPIHQLALLRPADHTASMLGKLRIESTRLSLVSGQCRKMVFEIDRQLVALGFPSAA